MKKFLIFLFLLTCFSRMYGQQTIEMRANLYAEGALYDGSLTQYGDDPAIFSDSVNGYDARKILNFGQNFGLKRHNTILVIERRPVVGNRHDTSFIWMTNMWPKAYRFETILTGIRTDSALLQDLFLGTQTELKLNETNDYDFSVTTSPGSYNPARFRIVFKPKDSVIEQIVTAVPVSSPMPILRIFPNPARTGGTVITLQFSPQSIGLKKVIMYDMMGNVIVRKDIIASNNIKMSLPTQLQKGLYTITILEKGKTFSSKISLQ